MRARSIFGAFAVVVLAFLVAPAAIAVAQGGGGPGPSTPNVTVMAQDPATSATNLRLTLVAHTDKDANPQASLVLRTAGMDVTDYQVHRIAAGDTSCGGHETAPVASSEEDDGVRAVVRGVGVLRSGGAVLPDGSAVQVWIDLKDVGTTQYADQARVRVRLSPHGGEGDDAVSAEAEDEGGCSGGMGGWSYDSGWVSIQQVQIHQR